MAIDTPTDLDFIARFEAQQWPINQWRHRDHVRLAYLYLRRYSFFEAADQIRAGIKAHNIAWGLGDSPTSGYHETMTIAWLRLIDTIMREYGSECSSEAFADEHPELLEKKALRLFYSKGLLMSAVAKSEFVEPDLAALPRPRTARAQVGEGR
jgi:hypothetical protein